MPWVLPKRVFLCLILGLLGLSEVAFAQTKAIAGNGVWTVDAQSEPGTLRVLDRDQLVVRRYPLASLDGTRSSSAAEVFHAAPRQSFVIAPTGLNELWELSYNPHAEPIYDGYVHDYKMGEGIAKPGFLGLRRTPLDWPLKDLVFDDSYRHAIGVTPASATRPAELHVINLDIRRRIDQIELPTTSIAASTTASASGPCHAWNNWRWRSVSGRHCAP